MGGLFDAVVVMGSGEIGASLRRRLNAFFHDRGGKVGASSGAETRVCGVDLEVGVCDVLRLSRGRVHASNQCIARLPISINGVDLSCKGQRLRQRVQ